MCKPRRYVPYHPLKCSRLYFSEDPYTFTVGDEDILSGLSHGVIGMCTGERRRLRIPPELAYGDVNKGKICNQSSERYVKKSLG